MRQCRSHRDPAPVQAALKRVEATVHPLVADERERWLGELAARGERLALLDVPLLYETGLEAEVRALCGRRTSCKRLRALVSLMSIPRALAERTRDSTCTTSCGATAGFELKARETLPPVLWDMWRAARGLKWIPG